MFSHHVLISLVALGSVLADINLHNPRGGNNRHDESTRQRRNGNRLFDSQNNARGGHNVGPSPGFMYYYGGSQLTIRWANQHSCGDENNNCQVVIQYMCDENLRDGTTSKTPPTTCTNDCDTNPKFGHHESINYYEACSMRERNRGLFTADRNTDGRNTAKYTRQNDNGNRRGYECPEEKDYYPYWADSPWKDIAIMTNDQDICEIVTANSQNVKSRWVCTFSDEDWEELRGKVLTANLKDPILYLNQDSCEEASITFRGKTYQPQWTEVPSHGIDAPECIPEQYSRDNHQGNTIGGEFLEYIWTVPNIDEEHCALRIRYNISTNDFLHWTTDHTDNVNGVRTNNGNFGPEEIYESYGFEGDRGDVWREVRRRQYYLKNNPKVDVFDTTSKGGKRFQFQLALNTAQFGRTFQDRSHSFAIRKRPDDIADSAMIYNLNVQGKRGNLAQVYPGTEYDFVPGKLHTTTNDYLHVQWTGSDNNPLDNAGQGKARTDRTNIVELGPRPYAEADLGSNLTLGVNYPPESPCGHELFGLNRAQLTRLALAGDFEIGDTPGVTLDDANAYFDYGLMQTKTPGKHYFFSTRNNAFSNRDQKAEVTTTEQ